MDGLWAWLLLGGVLAFATKLAGYLVPARWLERPAVAAAAGRLTIGLLASWLGTLCWNRASQLLPTSLTGQLIVFETLAALAYGFVHRGSLPEAWTWAGIVLLVAGVVTGTRVFAQPTHPPDRP